MQLAIVICDFNGWGQTENCLRSLEAAIDSSCMRVFLVDHGTENETTQRVAETFSGFVDLISDSPELWWTGATNAGVRAALKAGAQRIMLLNNDCRFSAENFRRTLDHSSRFPSAIVAPVQLDAATGAIVSGRPRACLLFGFTVLSSGRNAVKTNSKGNALMETGLIAGCRGVVIPASVFKAIGIFDEESLPHYGADHDFYFRCRKAGVLLLIATDSTVDVDNTRTSVSRAQYGKGIRGLLTALTSERSHCNLRFHVALYRKHYPIPGLYYLGVGLFATRYAMTFLVQDIRAKLARTCGNNHPSAE